MTRYEAMLALCCMTELGLNVKLKLLSLYGRPELIIKKTAAQLKEAGLMTETQLAEYEKWNDPEKINIVIKEMEKRDMRYLLLSRIMTPRLTSWYQCCTHSCSSSFLKLRIKSMEEAFRCMCTS